MCVPLVFIHHFGSPKKITTPADVKDYIRMVETWMNSFPPEFLFKNSDTTSDAEFPWIAFHRQYLHAAALSMALGPLKPFMIKHMTASATPEVLLDLRSTAIDYALKLIDALHQSFNCMWERKTTFHFLPFSILETAALLCSCVQHDHDGSAPRRSSIFSAIDLSLYLLSSLSTATDTATNPYDILYQLSSSMSKGPTPFYRRKRGRVDPTDDAYCQNEESVLRASVFTINQETRDATDSGSAGIARSSFTASAIETPASYSEGEPAAIHSSYGQGTTANRPPVLPSSNVPGESVWKESDWNDEDFGVQSALTAFLLSPIENGPLGSNYGVFEN